MIFQPEVGSSYTGVNPRLEEALLASRRVAVINITAEVGPQEGVRQPQLTASRSLRVREENPGQHSRSTPLPLL